MKIFIIIIYFLNHFQIYNPVLLAILTLLNIIEYIPRTHLSYNWKFVSFYHLHISPTSSASESLIHSL